MSPFERVPKVMVGGLAITALSRSEWTRLLVDYCVSQRSPGRPIVVGSVNGQIVAMNATRARFRETLSTFDALDADGQSLVFASRLLTSTPLPERVPTTDLFHDVAEAAQRAGLSFYFLGGSQWAVENAVQCATQRYPDLKVAGLHHGHFAKQDEAKVVEDIARSRCDVLWVGMGAPLQEEFVRRNLDRLSGVKWIKTCGGLFDFFKPEVRRAPVLMQRLGLEWLFRAIQEPRRLAYRYLTTNLIAIPLLLLRTGTLRSPNKRAGGRGE